MLSAGNTYTTTLPAQYRRGEKKHSVDIHGVNLSYKVSGAGPPLIFHHGWIGNEDTFAMCHQAFAKYFTVYRPAWPGYGDSSPMKHFSIEDFACLSHEFIKKLKLKNPVIIGNCLGGNIAMEMVRMYPRLISRLILVEVYGFFPNVYRLLLAPGLNKLLYRTLFKTRKGFDFLNSYMPLQQTDGNNGWEYTWEGFERTHVDSALKFLKAIYVYAKGTFKARFENYTSDIPAVYVEGGRTFGPAAEFSTMVNKYYSNLEKVSIPESLHNPVVEKPELFSERVLSAMGF